MYTGVLLYFRTKDSHVPYVAGVKHPALGGNGHRF